MKKFDYNLIVIGAGAAGLVSSYIAAATNAKVALIEQHKMGGDCLNTGCVPSKALIKTAKVLSQIQQAEDFGLGQAHVEWDFQTVMQRVQRIIATIEPHDSVERYSQLGVDCIAGQASITGAHEVLVNGSALTARAIIVATGARPRVPDLPGLADIAYLTSDNLWQLSACPERLAIIGGGPIGVEMAQAFARLGANVTIIERSPTLMSREDANVTDFIEARLRQADVTVLTQHEVEGFSPKTVTCLHQGERVDVGFDQVLIALGRQANIEGFGLETLGVQLNKTGTVAANALMQTNIPSIYVCGDVTGPYQFTHAAAHQAWYASINALFSPFKRFKVDYRVIPWVTFTDPEVARVGLNEKSAQADGVAYEVSTYHLSDLDRAITESEAYGFIKVLTRPKSDKILGVTIIGAHAGELLAEFVLAMKHGIGLNKILGTIHAYPTFTEANKYVAGQWRQAHKPNWAMRLLRRFHTWRR
ncbi:hypothetical protein GCU85_03380 [Cardiobacteriales bacterium ML27]|uniref:Pyruvate/2-oxoglutarate dehydrogenase complex dihydrolipoamide dehydrogenase (E3) component n=1 Tax=Ostreibacterium oceani TaxID=2654998 RepID=A0A6N7ETA0_9GAMM|nr:FAD-dependent oxidoreductase [Ostreibacterium oceani]MPV85781.1 hypothetical protein [Ostreibacterium oceani]